MHRLFQAGYQVNSEVKFESLFLEKAEFKPLLYDLR